MHNEDIKKLSLLLQRFPGIGPRQAARFVYSLIDQDEKYIKSLIALLTKVSQTGRCSDCFQVAEANKNKCRICESSSRDSSVLLVAEKDTDLANIESAGSFNGLYHLLGGTISPLKPDEQIKHRLKHLFEKIKNNKQIKEIILAMSATKEGEHTASYVARILEPLQKTRKLKISRLGQGLSTGSELEYCDHETIKSALNNRK